MRSAVEIYRSKHDAGVDKPGGGDVFDLFVESLKQINVAADHAKTVDENLGKLTEHQATAFAEALQKFGATVPPIIDGSGGSGSTFRDVGGWEDSLRALIDLNVQYNAPAG
ncbi:MAG: hypothetical protein AAFX94_10120 [Myxococcota bacterium]